MEHFPWLLLFGQSMVLIFQPQTVLICRFFDGLFGSCPLAVVAAIFADMYSNET
jgi:hypothetical protein